MLETVIGICCFIGMMLTATICILNFQSRAVRMILDVLVAVLLLVVIGGTAAFSFRNGGQKEEEKTESLTVHMNSEKETEDIMATPYYIKDGTAKNMPETNMEKPQYAAEIAEDNTRLKIGVLTTDSWRDGNLQVAVNQGYLESILNEMSFQTISRSEIPSAVLEKDIEVFVMSGESFLELKNDGVALKAVAVINTLSNLCAAYKNTDSDTNTPQSVAYAPGTTQELFWKNNVCAINGYTETDYQTVTRYDMDSVSAIGDGAADIAIGDAVSVHWAVKEGNAGVGPLGSCMCSQTGESMETGTMKLMVVSENFIREQPGVVEELCGGLKRAYADIEQAYLANGSSGVISLLTGEEQKNSQIYSQLYQNIDSGKFNPDFTEEIKQRLAFASNNIAYEEIIYETDF